jgi:hypothetical protein
MKNLVGRANLYWSGRLARWSRFGRAGRPSFAVSPPYNTGAHIGSSSWTPAWESAPWTIDWGRGDISCFIAPFT